MSGRRRAPAGAVGQEETLAITEDGDVTHLWGCLYSELRASKDEMMPQIAWLHWDIAMTYAERLTKTLGVDGRPSAKPRDGSAMPV